MNISKLTTMLLSCIVAYICNYAIANEKEANTSSQDKEYKYYATVGAGSSVHSEQIRTYVGDDVPGANLEGFKRMTPKSSMIVRLAAGTYFFPNKLNNRLRIEGEYAYHVGYEVKGTVDNYEPYPGIVPPFSMYFKYKIKVQTLFANLLYALFDHKYLKPYVGFGLGVAYNNLGTMRAYAKDNDMELYAIPGKNTFKFAYNLGTGIRFDVNKKFGLDLNYKYVDFGQPESKSTYFTEDLIPNRLRTHQMTLSGVVRFQ